MNLIYAISTDEETGNKYIFSQSNQANYNHSEWRERMSDKLGITEFIEVETEDSMYFSSSNLKYSSGGIVIDEEKLAKEAKDELRKQYKEERESALNDAEIIIQDMIFQTRPSDFINLTVGIAEGSNEWILKDDSIATVTTEHLKSVLKQGQTQAKVIFDIYISKIKTL